MPHTKPDLFFDEEGVCSACRFYEERKLINWESRRKELEKIFSKIDFFRFFQKCNK